MITLPPKPEAGIKPSQASETRVLLSKYRQALQGQVAIALEARSPGGKNRGTDFWLCEFWATDTLADESVSSSAKSKGFGTQVVLQRMQQRAGRGLRVCQTSEICGETGCAGAKLLLLPLVPSHPRTHGCLTLARFK